MLSSLAPQANANCGERAVEILIGDIARIYTVVGGIEEEVSTIAQTDFGFLELQRDAGKTADVGNDDGARAVASSSMRIAPTALPNKVNKSRRSEQTKLAADASEFLESWHSSTALRLGLGREFEDLG